MKLLITSVILMITQLTWSQTKVSVSDGDWNNPQTWNPASVPQFNEDSVIINHEVETFASTNAQINHLIIGTNGVLYTEEVFTLSGNLKIDGEFSADTLIIGDGDYFINNNELDANMFVTTNLMNENYGLIDMFGTLTNSEPFLNASGATIETLDLITTSDADFENNGTVYTDGWINEGTVLGSGSFCIEGCFQNVGNINGTLDVCDVNPNGGPTCDFNFGTIASTVTMCTAGPCSVPAGLTSTEIKVDISIFPNPSSNGQFNIETVATIINAKVIDLTGRILVEQSNSDLKLIDISSLDSGEYLLILETTDAAITKRIVKSN